VPQLDPPLAITITTLAPTLGDERRWVRGHGGLQDQRTA